MQLTGVLSDPHTLVRGAQRLTQMSGHERRLRVLQQDVRQASDQSALTSLNEHPLGLGRCFVGVPDDHQQERAMHGQVADRHTQPFGPDRTDSGWKGRD